MALGAGLALAGALAGGAGDGAGAAARLAGDFADALAVRARREARTRSRRDAALGRGSARLGPVFDPSVLAVAVGAFHHAGAAAIVAPAAAVAGAFGAGVGAVAAEQRLLLRGGRGVQFGCDPCIAVLDPCGEERGLGEALAPGGDDRAQFGGGTDLDDRPGASAAPAGDAARLHRDGLAIEGGEFADVVFEPQAVAARADDARAEQGVARGGDPGMDLSAFLLGHGGRWEGGEDGLGVRQRREGARGAFGRREGTGGGGAQIFADDAGCDIGGGGRA